MLTGTALTLTAAVAIWCLPPQAQAQTPLGSEFTYQGKPGLGGEPLSDPADFKLALWDAQPEGNLPGPVGSAARPPSSRPTTIPYR